MSRKQPNPPPGEPGYSGPPQVKPAPPPPPPASNNKRTDWQPIKTAPKDGRVILVYSCQYRRHIFGRAYYFKGVPGDGEGWITTSFYTTPLDDCRGSMEPTHWMPMPEPPVVT